MGYKIPGADYTVSPQLQTNVAKDLGMQLGKMFASVGPAFAAQQKETEKLNQIRADYETTTMVENQKVIDAKLAAGEKQIKDKSIFDQWSEEVVRRGEEATQAQIDIRFGDDLTKDEKKKKLDIISNFNNYNNKSLDEIAGLTGDIDAWSDPVKRQNNIIVGNEQNGEYLLNTMTMDVLSGKSVTSLFGQGATATKTLNVDGNDNEIHSVITVPKNGSYIKTMNSKNSSFKDVINMGIQEGNIKLSADGKNYIFERKINLNAYGEDGGFDFVIEPQPKIDPMKTLQDAGFVDKDGGLRPESLVRTSGDPESPPNTYQTEEELANNRVGIKTYEFLDMNLLENPNGAFMASINATTASVLTSKRPEVIAANLSLNYGVSDVKSWNGKNYKNINEFLTKAPEADIKSFVNESIKQKIFNEEFNKGSGTKGESLVPLQIDKKLQKYLADNNITKPDGSAYVSGKDQFIYTKEKYDVQTVSKPGTDKVNLYQNTLNQLNAPGANPQDILASPIAVPGGNKIGYDPISGQYVVYNSDGSASDQNLTIEQVKLQLQRGI